MTRMPGRFEADRQSATQRRPFRRRPLVAAIALGLAGCAVGPGQFGQSDPGGHGAAGPSTVMAAGEGAPMSATVGERTGATGRAGSPYANRVPGEAVAPYVPGEVVVGLAVGAEPPRDLGALGTAQVADVIRLTRRYALLRLPEGADMAQALARLRSLPDVVSAEPNYRTRRRSTPPTDDPLLPAQWSYEPEVADVYGAWEILDDQPVARFDDTVVAVVDSMADPGHPDLNVVDTFWSANALSDGADVPTLGFSNSFSDHGTGCAGVAGARKANGVGAAGVVPGVPILSIHVDDENGGAPSFSILRALMIAAYYNRSDSPYPNLTSRPGKGKVRVVNLSMGPSIIGREEPFDSAMEFLRQRGIVVAVAAGNNGLDGRVEVPANSPAAIGVAASMQYLGFELLAPYSSHGPEIWVTGPGNFIWTTGHRASSSSDYSSAYRLFNGTSSAAPFVAGVAAAVNIVYGSGGADQETAAWADDVKRRLADTADDMGSPGFDSVWGHGRVNARRAITGTLD